MHAQTRKGPLDEPGFATRLRNFLPLPFRRGEARGEGSFAQFTAGCSWSRCMRQRERRLSMCGIIGYIGKKTAAPILLEGLRRLEYRGYDSAGLAVLGDNALLIRKKKGKIDEGL